MLTRRSTSNSRGPGQKNMPVTITVGRAATCPKCGGRRIGSLNPHAPHFDANGRGLVDCVGDVIKPLEDL